MRVKHEPSLKWEDAPDIITPQILAKIIGISLESARTMFRNKNFPKIPGEDFKADKIATRLYMQGFSIRTDNKNSLLYMQYIKLEEILKQIEAMKIEDEEMEVVSNAMYN